MSKNIIIIIVLCVVCIKTLHAQKRYVQFPDLPTTLNEDYHFIKEKKIKKIQEYWVQYKDYTRQQYDTILVSTTSYNKQGKKINEVSKDRQDFFFYSADKLIEEITIDKKDTVSRTRYYYKGTETIKADLVRKNQPTIHFTFKYDELGRLYQSVSYHNEKDGRRVEGLIYNYYGIDTMEIVGSEETSYFVKSNVAMVNGYASCEYSIKNGIKTIRRNGFILYNNYGQPASECSYSPHDNNAYSKMYYHDSLNQKNEEIILLASMLGEKIIHVYKYEHWK